MFGVIAVASDWMVKVFPFGVIIPGTGSGGATFRPGISIPRSSRVRSMPSCRSLPSCGNDGRSGSSGVGMLGRRGVLFDSPSSPLPPPWPGNSGGWNSGTSNSGRPGSWARACGVWTPTPTASAATTAITDFAVPFLAAFFSRLACFLAFLAAFFSAFSALYSGLGCGSQARASAPPTRPRIRPTPKPPKLDCHSARMARMIAATPARMRPSPRNQVITPQVISRMPMTRVDTPPMEEIWIWMLSMDSDR